MKNKIITALLSVALLVGCKDRELISSEIIDTRFTPAHSEVVTTYEYQFDWLEGEFKYLPNTHTEWIADKYEVCEQYTFDNGDIVTQWNECDKEVYEENGGV